MVFSTMVGGSNEGELREFGAARARARNGHCTRDDRRREANGTKLRPGVVKGHLSDLGLRRLATIACPSAVEHQGEDRAVRESFEKRRNANATIAVALRRQRHDSRVMSRRRETADRGGLGAFDAANDVTASLGAA